MTRPVITFRTLARVLGWTLGWLALGTVLNVGVAWWFAVTDPNDRHSVKEIGPPFGPWPRPTMGPWPPPVLHQRRVNLGVTLDHYQSAAPPPKEPASDDALDCAQSIDGLSAGFPFRSVGVWIVVDFMKEDGSGTRIDGGLPIGATSGALADYFPSLPVWPGFALNTILYALLAWGVSLALGAVRRRIRSKRGPSSHDHLRSA